MLAGLGLMLLTVTATPLVRWWATALAGPWTDPKGDVLIVLSGGMLRPGFPDQTTLWRTLYAAEAWKGGFRTVVVSGRDAAPAMKKLLLLAGVPESAIVVENDSLTTRESALRTAALLRGTSGRLVLLTSDSHMYRAVHSFRKAGLAVEPRPFPDALKQSQDPIQRWPVFFGLAGETARILRYRWLGWI